MFLLFPVENRSDFFPLITTGLFIFGFLSVLIAGQYLCTRHKASPPTDDTSMPKRFSFSFPLISLLFVILSFGSLLLIPWAFAFDQLGAFGFFSGMLFSGLLAFGFFYAWRKGALKGR